MFRNATIAGGLVSAVLMAGCASTPAATPAPAAAVATAPAAPKAPAVAATPTKVAAAQGPGEATFSGRCAGCHGAGVNGAPPVSVLAMREPGSIVEALTTGKMARMGAALSDEDKANVAMFLTKKPLA